jgi:hypothetical protein
MFFLRVALQQECRASQNKTQDQRIVVAGLGGRPPVPGRREHTHLQAAETKFVFAAKLHHADVLLPGNSQHVFQRSRARVGAKPQFVWPEIRQHAGEAAQVVAVAVGQGHCIQAGDAAPPQVGGDDVLAIVEF